MNHVVCGRSFPQFTVGRRIRLCPIAKPIFGKSVKYDSPEEHVIAKPLLLVSDRVKEWLESLELKSLKYCECVFR